MHKILLHWFVKDKSMDQFETWKAILRKDLLDLQLLQAQDLSNRIRRSLKEQELGQHWRKGMYPRVTRRYLVRWLTVHEFFRKAKRVPVGNGDAMRNDHRRAPTFLRNRRAKRSTAP